MIPISDCPETGKKRFVTESTLKKINSGDIEVFRVIEYFEADGITPAKWGASGLNKGVYESRSQFGTTADSFIDPETNLFVENPNYGIPEKDYFRGIPLSSLPSNITTIGQVIDYLEASSIAIADLNGKF